jgi:hypothetical protein
VDGHPKKNNKTGTQEVWSRHAELASNHSFVVWNKQFVLHFPVTIRAKFSHHAYGLAADVEPRTLPSPQVALEVLDFKKTFRAMRDSLCQALDLRKEHAVADYLDFVGRIAKAKVLPVSSFQLAPDIPNSGNSLLTWPR